MSKLKSPVIGVCCFILGLASAQAEPLLQPNDRLAICGDGLMAGRSYSTYIEDYLLMAQPVPGLDIAEFGWSARDPAGFLARLDTDLLPYKPTIVLISFNTGDVSTREKAEIDLIEALKKAGVHTIVLGSPQCVDSFHYHKDPAQAAALNQTLGELAGIDRSVAAKEGVIHADVFGLTTAAMVKAKADNDADYRFGGEDGFTPGDGCKLVTAYAFLKALGCDGNVGTISIDFTAGAAEGSPGQKIISYADNKLVVESSRQPFHFPAYPSGRPDPDPILKYIPFNDELNRYTLIVKNLPTARTKISWYDENHDYSSDDLAKGVNLTAAMLNRAFAGPSENVGAGSCAQQQQEWISGTALVQGKPDPQADAKREALLQAAKDRVKPLQRTIEIQPLAPVEKRPPGPIPVIVDTDMDGDVDDVGSVALLNSFMDQGEARLIACVTNTRDKDLSSGATVQAINTWYGHPAIPIGSYYGESGPTKQMTSILEPAPPGQGYHGPVSPVGSHYTLQVHQHFDPDFPDDDKLPAGVDVYRKALAAAADGTVVIASLGLLQNLQDLVQSQPDSVSNLNGIDLVRKKVRELVVMANTVPQDSYVLGKWPTKIVWTTFVGNSIYTGKALINTPENNPVRFAYAHFGDDQHNALKDGRQSWDLTAAWLAVRGPGDLWDEISGHWQINPPGKYGTWIPQGKDRLIIPQMSPADAAKLIDAELSRPPKS
jgi:hypothetical protein